MSRECNKSNSRVFDPQVSIRWPVIHDPRKCLLDDNACDCVDLAQAGDYPEMKKVLFVIPDIDSDRDAITRAGIAAHQAPGIRGRRNLHV